MLSIKRAFHTTNFRLVRPEEVLSPKNRERTVSALSSMKNIATGKSTPSKRAAVLVPLCVIDGEVSLLFTVRSMELKNNRGQVAYPGGMADENDRSLEETAMREAREEIGLTPQSVDVWGPGPSIGREDMIVTPYLAHVHDVNLSSLRLNSAEVERAFVLSLLTMSDPANFRTTHFRSKNGHYTLPVFMSPNFRIWGLTALITHTMLHALLPNDYKNKIKRQVMTSKRLPGMGKAQCST